MTRDGNPAAVLFDMDGTLVDSEKLWTVAMDDYAAHRGGAIRESTRANMVGSNMTRSMLIVLDEIGAPGTAEELDHASRWVAGRMTELFADGLPWRPGAAEALRAVRAQGLRSALVTSTIRSLTEIALDTLGRGSFDATVCGDEVGGKNKPDPEPYLRAARMLRVDPADCLALEDSPTGVASAEAAGCTVLAVPCEVALEEGPQRVLRSSLLDVDFTALGALLAGARPAAGRAGTGIVGDELG
ncbi:HAD family phosphatase [Saccharopolyspora sp. HNM0983]|uniref:HAD family phosphatase n=1 Tax=Saccharopolyspora montiporae TaxID=2781240 RepID=A0A929B8U0_9PSEU|nr:HAD family phosphatase [Saccharopolyspora sp. HNM0983]MBE9373526.1 HAD family phosphatase [Saccharopolyspora sp. HNM0983]